MKFNFFDPRIKDLNTKLKKDPEFTLPQGLKKIPVKVLDCVYNFPNTL